MYLLSRIFLSFCLLTGITLVSEKLTDIGSQGPNSREFGVCYQIVVPQAFAGVLLARVDVQAELKLDDGQRSRIGHCLTRLSRSFQSSIEEFEGSPFDATATDDHFRQQDMRLRTLTARLKADFDSQTTEILNPPQLVRLKQLRIQTEGAVAFHRSDVIARLQLTASQQRKIREISPFALARFAGQERNTAHQALRAALSHAQFQAWNELKGLDFEFDNAQDVNPLLLKCSHAVDCEAAFRPEQE